MILPSELLGPAIGCSSGSSSFDAKMMEDTIQKNQFIYMLYGFGYHKSRVLLQFSGTQPIPILPCCFVCCSYSVNTHDVGNHPQQEIEIENPI